MSPEDAAQLDLTGYVRRLMAQVERDQGRRVEWAAVNHYNTEHPHAHLVIRGVDRQGRELRFERSYLAPELAERALHQGRELREAIHDVFWAIMNKRPAPPAALARLNAAAQAAAGHMHLAPAKGGGFEWRFDDFGDFDTLLWPIARAAADLLASDQLAYVRACSSKNCEWFFLDASKNHHRRWCDMTRCGNRAKVQRFYVRKKKSS